MTVLTINRKEELYALQNISLEQIVYSSNDNCFYHLRDWSRRNKSDGWRITTSTMNLSIKAGVHDLVSSFHTVSGLTAGNFLKATSPTTFGFAAHGLTYSDVNAISKNSPSIDKEILTWDGITGNIVRTSTGVSIDSGNVLANADCIAYASGPPAGWTPYTFRYSLVESGGNVNLVGDAASPGNDKMYGTDGTGTKGWFSVPAAMVYPSAGIPISNGTGWDVSIVNNSVNWNTAYGWGNHASAGYAPIANPHFTGSVGINNATPSFPLSFAAAVGDKIALYDNGAAIQYGFGIQANLLQIYCDTSTDRVGIGYGTSASFTETLTVKGDRIGVNTISPVTRVDIKYATDIHLGIRDGQADATAIQLNAYNEAGAANIPMEFKASKFNFTNGSVGINKVTPAHELDVTGTIVASADIIAYHS